MPVFRVLETESDSQCHLVFCPCLRTSTSADVGVRVQVTGIWGEDESKQPGKSAKGDIIQRDWVEREGGQGLIGPSRRPDLSRGQVGGWEKWGSVLCAGREPLVVLAWDVQSVD